MMYILDSNVRLIASQVDGNARLKRLNSNIEFDLKKELTLAKDIVTKIEQLTNWSEVISGGKSRKARRRRAGSRKFGAKKPRYRTRSR